MNEKIEFNKLFLLAIILFLFNAGIFCFLIYPKIEKKLNLHFDGEGYQKIAFNILSGKGFFFGESDDPVLRSFGKPTLLRPPLYPYFISCVYYIFGFKPQIIVVCHIIINSLMIYFVYRIAKMVFHEKAAILSSFICAFYLPFIWFLSRLYNENIFNFLLVFSIFYSIKNFHNLSLRNSIICGILIGLSSLCKGQMAIFPLVLLPGLIYIYRKEKIKLFKRFSLILIFLLLIISPWTIRNYIVSGKFVLVQYGTAIHFLRGNETIEADIAFLKKDYTDSMNDAFAKEHKIIKQIEFLKKRNLTEIELDEIFNKIAKDYVKNNPFKFLEKILIGCLQFWYVGESVNKSLGLVIIQFPIILFAVLGIYYAHKKKIKLIIPLYSIILYFLIIHAIILSVVRYSIPVMPFVIIFASFGIINLYDKLFFSKKKKSQI